MGLNSDSTCWQACFLLGKFLQSLESQLPHWWLGSKVLSSKSTHIIQWDDTDTGVSHLLESLGHTGRRVVLGHTLNISWYVITKISHNVLSKFMILCWAVFIHSEQHASHGPQVGHPWETELAITSCSERAISFLHLFSMHLPNEWMNEWMLRRQPRQTKYKWLTLDCTIELSQGRSLALSGPMILRLLPPTSSPPFSGTQVTSAWHAHFGFLVYHK